MSAVTNAVQGALRWWHSREPRERALLAVMVAAVAAFSFWLCVFMLQRVAATAQAHYDRAAADLAEVESGVHAIVGTLARRPAAPAGEAFASTILDAASAGGVPISRRRIDDAGVLTVGIDVVTAPALLGWLDGLRQQHGIAPQTLDIGERNGRLQAEVAFRPVAP